MSLDGKIDDLYRRPLDDFIASRNALAKTLSGADAKRVRALAKPTVGPWAVNQVYWHARPLYDKVIKNGERLRTAQIASLEGRRGVDLREAGDAHRRAVADAVKEAERLAAASGANPAADVLMRTFETLSLSSESPEAPGRLTRPLQPAGFEALAGITPQAPAPLAFKARDSGGEKDARPAGSKVDRKKELAAAEVARKRDAAIKSAAAVVARAEAAEQLARTAWERSHDKLLEARQNLTSLKNEKSEV